MPACLPAGTHTRGKAGRAAGEDRKAGRRRRRKENHESDPFAAPTRRVAAPEPTPIVNPCCLLHDCMCRPNLCREKCTSEGPLRWPSIEPDCLAGAGEETISTRSLVDYGIQRRPRRSFAAVDESIPTNNKNNKNSLLFHPWKRAKGRRAESSFCANCAAVFCAVMQTVSSSWRLRRPSNRSEVSTSATNESTASPEARPEQDRAAPARDEETSCNVSLQRQTHKIHGISQSLPRCAPSFDTQASGEPLAMDRPRADVRTSILRTSVMPVLGRWTILGP